MKVEYNSTKISTAVKYPKNEKYEYGSSGDTSIRSRIN